MSFITIKTAVGNCLWMFVFVVIPGLLVAGILETNLTPIIMEAAGLG